MKALHHSRTFLGRGLLCLVAVFLSGIVHGEDSADRIVSAEAAAYAVLIKADGARDRHDFQAATEQYQQASDLYRALSQTAPGWEPDVIKYRLSYCADQIQSIKRQMMTTGKSPAARPAEEPRRAAEIFDTLIQDNEALHRSLVEIQSGLSNLEGATDLKMDLQKLADENGQFYRALVEARADAEKNPVGALNNTRKFENKSESLKAQFLDQKEKAQDFIRQSEAHAAQDQEWEPTPQPEPSRKVEQPKAAPAPARQAVSLSLEPTPRKAATAPPPAKTAPADEEDIFAPVPMGDSEGGP